MNLDEIKLHIIEKLTTKEKPAGLTSLSEIFNLIKTGNSNSPEFFYDLRKLDQPSEKYSFHKANKLKAWLPSALFRNTFKQTDITSLTSLLYIDFDFKTCDKPELLTAGKKQELANNKNVLAAWISAGGKGVGCLVQVQGLDLNNYSSTYLYYGSQLFEGFDSACVNPGRKVCFSYDPEIYINDQAEVLPALPTYNNEGRAINEVKNEKSSLSSSLNENGTPNSLSIIDSSIHIDSQMGVLLTNTNEVKALCNQEGSTFSFLFNNMIMPNECEEGLQYKIYDQKKKFYSVFKNPNGKAFIGQRKSTMLAACASIILNNTVIFDQYKLKAVPSLFKILKALQSTLVIQPLDDYSLFDIIAANYNYYLQGNLRSKYFKEKYIAFSKNCDLSPSEKRIIGGQLGNKMKAELNKSKIFAAFYKLAEDNYGVLPTQKQVCEATGKGINTVAKYWKELNPAASNKTKSKFESNISLKQNTMKENKKTLCLEILPTVYPALTPKQELIKEQLKEVLIRDHKMKANETFIDDIIRINKGEPDYVWQNIYDYGTENIDLPELLKFQLTVLLDFSIAA